MNSERQFLKNKRENFLASSFSTSQDQSNFSEENVNFLPRGNLRRKDSFYNQTRDYSYIDGLFIDNKRFGK